MTDPRTEELAANLRAVQAGIASASAEVGRDPAEVTLVVVTKTWPAADVRRLAELGVRDVAENRDQEAEPKAEACRDLGLRWHFVGQLQTNKAHSVARYAYAVHSVDRLRLVTALDRAADRAERRLRVLLQVSLDEPGTAAGGRGGAEVSDLPALAEAVVGAGRLDLAGVMGVAPLGEDPEPAFARLAAVAADLRSTYPGATWISAGMTHDYRQAVRQGATHVRIGSAILGNRPPLR